MRGIVAVVLLGLCVPPHLAADGMVAADPSLRVVPIDTVDRASLLGVRVDTDGRVFVGGRDALFVYEPDAAGGYGPRRTLLTFPDHTWVHDIEILGDDLYVLTVSGLYHVRGGRRNAAGLEARRLLWGVPRGHTHQCFHGMAFGPEGDLYVGMGDPLWYYGDFARPDHWGHWTFFTRPAEAGLAASADEWRRTPYTGVGAVLRLRLRDGALRVVAEGLRNDCGLAFDRSWNLFTNDNDHESLPAAYVPGRLLHVSPRAWFGWPRGWSPDKTPDRLDLRATMNPALGRFVPVGQAYYDDPFLPRGYRNALLVARWCTKQVTFYPLEPAGATFRAAEGELLSGTGVARPVGIAVGRGGRLFVTVCHMDHNEDSPVYRSDLVMVTTAADAPEHPFEPYDTGSAAVERLFAGLGAPAWSIRREAHAELLRRHVDEKDLLARCDAAPRGSPERNHLLWLVAVRGSVDAAWQRVAGALDDASASTRLQAVRMIAERFPDRVSRLLPMLDDQDLHVAHAAIGACFEDPVLLDEDRVVDRLVMGPARSRDSHVRQAAVRLLGERVEASRLERLAVDPDPETRLAAALAAGFRLTVPSGTAVPPEHLPLTDWRNPDASYRLTFADGRVDLRDLGRLGTFTLAEHWKAGGRTRDQESLFEMLVHLLEDDDPRVRRQAAQVLATLADPRSEPRSAAVLAESAPPRAPVAHARADAAASLLPRERPDFDPGTFAGIDWAAEAARGNADRGRALFGEAGIGCGKCHAMSADATVSGGPSLAAAGKRFAVDYLADSVLEPDKVVAPLFRATTVVTADGRSLSGLVTGETGDTLELVMADGGRTSIPVAEIADRAMTGASPMPRGLVRTREELRDILAYLLADATAEAAGTGGGAP